MLESFSSLSETYLNGQVIFALFAAVGTFATIVLVGGPFAERDRLRSRMKAVSVERDKLRNRERARLTKEGKAKSLREKSTSKDIFIQKIVRRLNLKEALDDGSLSWKLAMAGYRGARPMTIFLFARVAVPVIVFALSLVYVFSVGLPGDIGVVPKIVLCVFVALVAYYIPGLIIRAKTNARQTSIRLAFPDALDLLLICVESGMSIEAALGRVSEELSVQSIALAEEFALTKAELSFLQERATAYENLSKRTGQPGIKACSLALIQAEKFGTPLGEALRVMAQENRDNRLILAEEKAASLPPKLTIPMMFFFLPVLFIIIVTPAVIQIIDILNDS